MVLLCLGNKRYTGECSKPEGRVFKSGTEGHGYKLLCPRTSIFDPANKLLGEDQSLNIRVEVTVFGDVRASNGSPDPTKPSAYTEAQLEKHSLNSHLSILFEKKKGTDLVLRSREGVEIEVHKAVLIARSEVFEAMFDHDTKEKKEKAIDLDDTETNVIREMVKFCYTDRVSVMFRSSTAAISNSWST